MDAVHHSLQEEEEEAQTIQIEDEASVTQRKELEEIGNDQKYGDKDKDLVMDMAMVGAAVSHIESLDYEINESELFKHDWRNRFLMGFVCFAGSNLALTAFSSFLCVRFAPTAAGPGVPEIKAYLNGVDTPDMYGFNTLIVKIFGSIAAVAANLDLGKEGPLVHTGACIANLVGRGGSEEHHLKWHCLRYLNNDRDRRDFMTCGASSGVCAAFRAPIGGVLFAFEEVSTWMRNALVWRAFFSTATVLVVLRAFIEYCDAGKCGLFGTGGLIIFDISNVTVSYKLKDLAAVMVLGVIAGVFGSFYNYFLHKILRLYSLINDKGALYKFWLAIGVSLVTSSAMYALPFISPCTSCSSSSSSSVLQQFNCPVGYYNDLATILLTTNDDAVRTLFSSSYEFHTMALSIFFVLYCVLGIITFGIAVPSGLFLPIILMGAPLGRLMGKLYASEIEMGVLAVLGAASFMAGSMRMTVSLCVIFLELTNNLRLLPIMMLVVLAAKTAGDCINRSIYEIILHNLKGLPFLDAKPKTWMLEMTVGDYVVCKPKVICIEGIERVGKVVEILKSCRHNGFPVINSECESGVFARLQGLVLRQHLVESLKKKWFLVEKKTVSQTEAREKFKIDEFGAYGCKEEEMVLEQLRVEEMDMFMDVHPITNATPYTVVGSMSMAKAMILFRQVGLRHLLVIQGQGGSDVIGILTRLDFTGAHLRDLDAAKQKQI